MSTAAKERRSPNPSLEVMLSWKTSGIRCIRSMSGDAGVDILLRTGRYGRPLLVVMSVSCGECGYAGTLPTPLLDTCSAKNVFLGRAQNDETLLPRSTLLSHIERARPALRDGVLRQPPPRRRPGRHIAHRPIGPDHDDVILPGATPCPGDVVEATSPRPARGRSHRPRPGRRRRRLGRR